MVVEPIDSPTQLSVPEHFLSQVMTWLVPTREAYQRLDGHKNEDYGGLVEGGHQQNEFKEVDQEGEVPLCLVLLPATAARNIVSYSFPTVLGVPGAAPVATVHA